MREITVEREKLNNKRDTTTTATEREENKMREIIGQEIVTMCDAWVDGSGFSTEGAIMAVETVSSDQIESRGRLMTCDDLIELDIEDIGGSEDSYRIMVEIYNISQDGERELYDECKYWVER